MELKLKKIRAELKKRNYKHKIKIRIRKTKSGKFSLFLDNWQNNKHAYEFLNIYLDLMNNSYNRDNDTMEYAVEYRNLQEEKLRKGFTNKKHEINLTAEFIPIFKEIAKTKKVGNKKKWDSTLNHLKEFAGNSLLLKDISVDFCFRFFKYLIKNTNQSTPKVYYRTFSAALNFLLYKGYIQTNPAKSARNQNDFKNLSKDLKEKEREYLTSEELKRFINYNTKYSEVQDAFITSCLSGLRLGDVRELTFKNIDDDHIKLTQNKTNDFIIIQVHDEIKRILKERTKTNSKNNKIFNLPDTKIINKRLKYIFVDLGIDKHITYHCARHTFATFCLTKDIDIYTVSKLLGHKNIETTEIYANLVDKKRDDAIKKLSLD
jgi:integrase